MRRDTPWGRGLVQLYMGPGKGKTTAAFGLALRAVGRGARVLICQFMKDKGPISGETAAATELEGIDVRRFGDSLFRTGHDPADRISADVERGLQFAEAALRDSSYDLVILDEIVVAVGEGLTSEERVRQVLDVRPAGVELVMTGRGPAPGLAEAADLVTEFQAVKHPFEAGTPARRGIEY